MFVPGYNDDTQGWRELLGRVDFAGAATLVTSLVLLLVGLNHSVPEPVTGLFAISVPLGLVLLVGFVWIEWRWAREPIIPLSLFRQRTTVAACLTAWFMSMAFYALTYYVPLYMKMLGRSTGQIGLRLLPDSIGAGLGSFLVGLVIRVTGRYGVFRYTMTLLLVLASMGFAFISVHTPWILPELYLLCKGFGMGGALTMLILALLHSVPHERHATATSALYAFRSTGATLGLSAASAMFYHRMNQSILDTGSSCKEGEQCYLDALHGAFQLALAFATAGFASALFVATYNNRE